MAGAGGTGGGDNQLARWFSPELLARASAGKLPSVHVPNALSLEDLERHHHSSAPVHNWAAAPVGHATQTTTLTVDRLPYLNPCITRSMSFGTFCVETSPPKRLLKLLTVKGKILLGLLNAHLFKSTLDSCYSNNEYVKLPFRSNIVLIYSLCIKAEIKLIRECTRIERKNRVNEWGKRAKDCIVLIIFANIGGQHYSRCRSEI